jgi:hypothetical protein
MLKFNRYYLIFSLLFSLLVPLFPFPAFITSVAGKEALDLADLRGSLYQFQVLSSKPASLLNLNLPIIYLYILISAFFLIRFTNNIIKLQLSRHKNPSVVFNGHTIVLIKDLALPYSFLSTIFVNEQEYREGLIAGELISHEIAHIDQHHTLDIIFIEILKVIFWFNPILIFYKKAIMLNHEYLADHYVTRSIGNNRPYQDILLNIVFRKNNSYLASSFNYSFTKKRLLMITKTKFSKTVILKKLITIPFFILVGLLVLDAQEKVQVHQPPPPPPPPPFGYNTWWAPILSQHKVTPDPSKSWVSGNLYETGDQFLEEDNKVTLKEGFVLSRSVDNLYRIVRAKLIIHDLNDNSYKCEGATVETYKQGADGASKLINTTNYKDFSFRINEDVIAPPPPPPPPLPQQQQAPQQNQVPQPTQVQQPAQVQSPKSVKKTTEPLPSKN